MKPAGVCFCSGDLSDEGRVVWKFTGVWRVGEECFVDELQGSESPRRE